MRLLRNANALAFITVFLAANGVYSTARSYRQFDERTGSPAPSAFFLAPGINRRQNTTTKPQLKNILAASTSLTRRVACGFYLWDAPSALLHKWCHYLMKDCVYEGRGGKMYVRVAPGSILQLLYPCSQYSPDRCLLCGGCFQDHLALWWSKQLYTPYDRHLEKWSSGGTETMDSRAKDKRNFHNLQRGEPDDEETERRYVFHRRYVNDSMTLKPIAASIANQSYIAARQIVPAVDNDHAKQLRQAGHKLHALSSLANRRSLTFAFARQIVANAVNNLIRLEEQIGSD